MWPSPTSTSRSSSVGFADASRSWRDDFTAATVTEFGEDVGSRLARTFEAAFPEAYKEDFSAATGALDLGRLEALGATPAPTCRSTRPLDAARGEARLKVFRRGAPISLSEVLPVLSSMGVEVVDERPYQLDRLDHAVLHLRLRAALPPGMPDHAREAVPGHHHGGLERLQRERRLQRARARSRADLAPGHGAARLREVHAQGDTPLRQDYIEEALRGNVDITRLLVQLFEARFDPAATAGGRRRGPHGAGRGGRSRRIERALDEVASLDHDRILRSYLTDIRATLRTNYFQLGADGKPHAYMSFKLEPVRDPGPAGSRGPRFEIFVYSPRVEGVHLRFGAVARGGLRWSDRRDDFRTEVLGLVKAQMVKNTVIVPVGAKGGFFCKQLPDPADRDAWLAEGIACYKTFICGLLDITDNLVDGARRCRPSGVVRHDGDDPYLVVAADKGTATFSDIANGVSNDYGFWLGDAFASGGSVGYDHKAMGITARGAWVSVQRHFRERGIDCQTEDFTCVGIGDMSGDVFGNGMLCSRAHPAGGRVRPPRHLPRPCPRRCDVVRRAEAAVRPATVELAGLRPVADLRGRRGLPAQR